MNSCEDGEKENRRELTLHRSSLLQPRSPSSSSLRTVVSNPIDRTMRASLHISLRCVVHPLSALSRRFEFENCERERWYENRSMSPQAQVDQHPVFDETRRSLSCELPMERLELFLHAHGFVFRHEQWWIPWKRVIEHRDEGSMEICYPEYCRCCGGTGLVDESFEATVALSESIV